MDVVHPLPCFGDVTRGTRADFSGPLRGNQVLAPGRALSTPDQPSQEGDQEQNQKNEKQEFCDSCGGDSDATETENRGDNRDYEKS